MYRSNEITRDWTPMPIPSRAPDAVTETVETINPALMIRRAVPPAMIVSALSVKAPISVLAIVRQSSVPAAMITPVMASVVL